MRRALVLLALVLALVPGAAARAAAPRSGTLPADPHRTAPWAWEPGLAQGPGGTLYVAGNHCALVDQHGVCQLDRTRTTTPDYTPLWRSTDGGRRWRFLADPLAGLEGGAKGGDEAGQDHPGGYDTDIAVAPAARARRPPLLYVVSAWEVSSTLSVSADGGRHWRVVPLAGTLPIQDRPWLATSGPCDLLLQYHLFTGSQNVASVPIVERYDGCALAAGETARPLSSTFTEPPAHEVTEGNQVMAKLAAYGKTVMLADRHCDTFTANLDCDAPGERQSVHVLISRDRGAHFSDVLLPDAHLGGALDDGTWPTALGADARGHAAVAAVDGRHVWLWASTDGGRHWRLREKPVDAPLHWAMTAVPTVAVRGHTIAVSWYGSPRAVKTQRWREVVARSDDGGARFRIRALPQTLARTAAGEALGDTLYDDNGLAITRSGAVVAAYTQSCAGHSTRDRACPPAPADGAANALTIRWAWLPR